MTGDGAQPLVRLVHATKRYGAVEAMQDVNLEVHEGEFFTLLGPSGCGKTTTLRSVAGFVHLTEGEIFIRDQPANHLPPNLRDVGMVFQSYALFPHMTVHDNVAFGLRMHRVPKSRIAERVAKVLRLVQLEGQEDKYPRQLSGGQQQRVALARVIVLEPSLLLFDEPLGALDKQLREQMQLELKRLQRELGITTMYVTHDQEEALTMSDRIAVMRHGRVLQVGTPREIYDAPGDLFVAGFIGHVNFLPGRVVGGDNGFVHVDLAAGGRVAGLAAGSLSQGAEAVLAVRPERVSLEADGGAFSCVEGTIRQVVYLGDEVRYEVALGDREVEVSTRQAAERQVGDRLRLGWRTQDARVYPA
ncbi:MAG TPA: ABC transporter ATP-binding protein [Chloroflexota bacterium]|nr:ABC transporter ATP-binding protein [Chloroflexota bacterium]